MIWWIAVPPLLSVGVGLGTFTAQRWSQRELNRTKVLADVLPLLVKTQRETGAVLAEFRKLGNGTIQSEDQLISFLQETARHTAFTDTSVKVERRLSEGSRGIPVLIAEVKGSGNFNAINQFIADVISEQHLLSERSVKISQSSTDGAVDYRAELSFELLLFNELKVGRR